MEHLKCHRLNHIQTVFNQIKILIQDMTNKKIMRNSKYELLNVNFLNKLINMIGWQGEKFLLLTILENIDLKDPNSKDKGQNSIKAQYFFN